MAAVARKAVAKRPLQVGIFADSSRQPRWLAESLARVAASGFAEIALVAVSGTRGAHAPLIWDGYGRIDRLLFGGPDPLKAMPIERLVAPARRIDFTPDDREWRAHVAGLGLDVAVDLGATDSRLDELARYGEWRYAFGEAGIASVGLAALSELVEGSPVVSSAIRIRRNGERRVACRSWSRTIPFSIARSHDRLFATSGEFLERSLRRVHEEGEDWLGRQALAPAEGEGGAPGVADCLRGIAALGSRVVRRTAESCFTVGQWSLAFSFGQTSPWTGSLAGFHRLVPPPDRFWADPFPIEVDGRHYVFFEELPFATGKGHISVVEVRRDGSVSTPQVVLERDHHLSYPFLLAHEGRLYMIPESGSNGTVEAWRCEEFPLRWRRERVLLEGRFLADATLHHDGGRWWMFANAGSERAGADDELHLFHASDPLGDWKPHRDNPVKSDVRCSRPAGRLFVEDGLLHRPGQICAPLYGSGIAMHRVTRLTLCEFAEEETRRIVPDAASGLLGMHTLNRAGGLLVTDVFARRRRF